MACTATASWDGHTFTIHRVIFTGMLGAPIPMPVGVLEPDDPGFGSEAGESRIELTEVGGAVVAELEPADWTPTRIVARVPAGRTIRDGVYGIRLDIRNRDTQCQSRTPTIRLPLIGGIGVAERGEFAFKCTRIHCVQASRDHDLNADGWHDELRIGGWRLDVDLAGVDTASRGFESIPQTQTMGDPNSPYKPTVAAPSSTVETTGQVGFHNGRTHTGEPLPYELWRGELAQASTSGPGKAVVILPVLFELDDEAYTGDPDDGALATLLGRVHAVLPGLGLPRDFLGPVTGAASGLAQLDRLWEISVLRRLREAAFISNDSAHTRPIGSKIDFVVGQLKQIFEPDVIVLTYETASLLADRGRTIQLRLEEDHPWLQAVYEVDYMVERIPG